MSSVTNFGYFMDYLMQNELGRVGNADDFTISLKILFAIVICLVNASIYGVDKILMKRGELAGFARIFMQYAVFIHCIGTCICPNGLKLGTLYK